MAIPGNMLSAATESMDPTFTGWRARAGATLASATGGRNGPKALGVKSITAGAVLAETVAAYPVATGVVYQVFADTSSATEPERIGIEWLNAANAPVGTVLWSMTTSSASASWHRVGVAGPAPAGAVRARIVLSFTAAAPAVVHYWENVYFGPPIRTTGNLLSFGTESTEIDASGWVPEVNATIGRLAPAASWPVDWYWAGGHVLTVTATAAGNTTAGSTESPTVTPGVEYLGYSYLGPPTIAAATWIELRFYDSNGNQITAVRSPLAPASTGYQRQQVSARAPSNAARARLAVGIDGASAGQVLRVEQAVITVAPALQAGSVLPYADSTFEQGVAGWTTVSGVATLTRSTPWGTYGYNGSYSLTVGSTTATTSVIRSARFPLAPGSGGLPFRLRYYSQVTAGSWTSTRGIRWYDAAGTDLGVTALAASTVQTTGWWMLGADFVAPAGAAQAAVEWTVTATAADGVLRLDKVMLWQAIPVMSVEVREPTASISLSIRELTAGDLTRVYRVTESGARTLVRGPDGLYDGTVAITADLIIIEDYEAPLGVPVQYFVELVDAVSGATETRYSDWVVIPHDDINITWLKDPANPQRNLRVMVARAPDWQRPIEQSAYIVRGRRNKVVLSGRRQGLEGELGVWTFTDDDRAALHWLLDDGNTLLWQAAPGMGVDDMYVSVAEVPEARTGGPAMEQMRAWTLPLTEQDMPTAVGVGGSAGRTWQDVLAENTTWQNVLDRFATWEDVFFNRPIGD